MAQSVALRTTPLPALIRKLQQDLALTDHDAELAGIIVAERNAKTSSIALLVQQYGLTVMEVGEVYDARDRINAELGAGQGETTQTLSLKQIVLFQQRFKSVPLDGESLAKQVLELHARFQDNYLAHILEQLAEMAKRQPGALPESLADLLEGRMEHGWPDSGQDEE